MTNSTRSTLTQEVSARLGVPAEDCRACLEALLDTVATSLADGHPVTLRGFGTWSTRRRKGHIGRNPHTGEAVPVPPHRAVRFVAHRGMGI